ncbi:hypothetical protein D3C74_372390 [compost metagenome]
MRFDHIRFAEKNIKQRRILQRIQFFDPQNIDVVAVILLKQGVAVHIKGELSIR